MSELLRVQLRLSIRINVSPNEPRLPAQFNVYETNLLMFVIVILVIGAATGAGLLLATGLPLVAMRMFCILPFDRRLWWVFATIVAYLAMRDLIHSSYNYAPPTAPPDKFYYSAHLLGGQLGVIIPCILGLLVLIPVGKSSADEQVHKWIAYPAATLVSIAGIAAIVSCAFPLAVRRANCESQRKQLVEAIRTGDAASLLQLLSAGAKADGAFKQLNNQWALDYAIDRQLVEIVSCLIDPPRGRAAKVSDRRFANVLRTQNRELIDALLQGKNRKKRLGIGLRAAISCNDVKMFSFMLASGASPNARDGFDTPLTICARDNRVEFATELMERGADMNGFHGSPDLNRGSTPLITAVDHGHDEMVQLLLVGGVDVNKTTERERSALQAACRFGHRELVKLLIEHGSDVNYQSGSRKWTALHWTLKSKKIEDAVRLQLVELLLAAGADYNLGDRQGITPNDITKRQRQTQ